MADNAARIPRDRAWVDRDGNVLDTAEKLAAHLARLEELRRDPAKFDALAAKLEAEAAARRAAVAATRRPDDA